jgi:hypothetical protein
MKNQNEEITVIVIKNNIPKVIVVSDSIKIALIKLFKKGG